MIRVNQKYKTRMPETIMLVYWDYSIGNLTALAILLVVSAKVVWFIKEAVLLCNQPKGMSGEHHQQRPNTSDTPTTMASEVELIIGSS